jgi:hypothetical protein
VFWASSMTHMDHNIFPNLNKFDPFLLKSQLAPYSFVAFGGGAEVVRQNCVRAGEAIQVAPLLQGQHLRQKPHADAVAWAAHRARAQR